MNHISTFKALRPNSFLGHLMGVGCLWLLAVLGPTSSPGQATTTSSAVLDSQVSITLEEADAKEVFKSTGVLIDAQVEVSPHLEGQLSIQLEKVQVRTLLGAICDNLHCRWRLIEEDGLKTLEVEPRLQSGATISVDQAISTELSDASPKGVMMGLARILGADLRISPSLELVPVTLYLTNAPVAEHLDALCASLDCRWSLVPGTSSTLWIEPSS